MRRSTEDQQKIATFASASYAIHGAVTQDVTADVGWLNQAIIRRRR
jgi:hypothetical protein